MKGRQNNKDEQGKRTTQPQPRTPAWARAPDVFVGHCAAATRASVRARARAPSVALCRLPLQRSYGVEELEDAETPAPGGACAAGGWVSPGLAHAAPPSGVCAALSEHIRPGRKVAAIGRRHARAHRLAARHAGGLLPARPPPPPRDQSPPPARAPRRQPGLRRAPHRKGTPICR